MPESSLAKGLSNQKRLSQPVWDGPESDSKQGGVTQSLLGRYLCCHERFRLMVMEGLKPADQWEPRTGYGNMWHVCEEAHAANKSWNIALVDYCRALCRQYPMQQEQIDHWYNVCKIQFPLYVSYWSKHKDVLARTPLLQEQTFHVPYALPSGRTVYLRGKWDSVDLIVKEQGIYLQENKSKSEIDEGKIKRQLTFDLQTMLYLIALQRDREHVLKYPWTDSLCKIPILGVRYNVIRRPLSGGKGTIRQHKPTKSNPKGESKDEFYSRVGDYIREEPDTYFVRWKCEVSEVDIQRFKTECLHPLLENLCDDYEWWKHCFQGKVSPYAYALRHCEYRLHIRRHLREPYGVYNVVREGGTADLDEYINSGSTVGLQRGAKLFSELE